MACPSCVLCFDIFVGPGMVRRAALSFLSKIEFLGGECRAYLSPSGESLANCYVHPYVHPCRSMYLMKNALLDPGTGDKTGVSGPNVRIVSG